MSMKSSDTRKTVLVTGASRGIGRAIAGYFAGKEQYRVIGTATTPQGAELIHQSLGSTGGAGYQLQVEKQESVDEVLSTIAQVHGGVDILINNAGITRDGLLMGMKDEAWDQVLNINLDSVFKLSRACIRSMLRNKWGRIINVSSVVAFMGNAGQTNYAAAKAGMIGFTRSLAREVGSRNVTVNAVAPGFIETDMTKELNEQTIEKLKEQIALKRLGQPEDIAAAVLFLASDQASYITGETIHVNGGMYMG